MNDTPWESPLYSVSPYNYDPEVRSLYNFREPLVILDSTLAKMAHMQASRLYSAQDHVEVTGLLEEAGVQEMMVFVNQYNGTYIEEMILEGLRAVAKAGFKMKLRIFDVPGPLGKYREQVDRLVDSGAHSLIIVGALSGGFPPGTIEKLPDEAEVEQRSRELRKLFEYGRKVGLEVGMSTPQDMLRADSQSVIDQMNMFIEWGA